jgi:hypothetical protein
MEGLICRSRVLSADWLSYNLCREAIIQHQESVLPLESNLLGREAILPFVVLQQSRLAANHMDGCSHPQIPNRHVELSGNSRFIAARPAH